MKTLITLLLLIPSLSWGLTFKNGEQVSPRDDNDSKLKEKPSGNNNYDYEITKPGLIFITKENFDKNILEGDSSKCSFQILSQPEILKSSHDTLSTIGERALLSYCNDIKKLKGSTNSEDENINTDLLNDLNDLFDSTVPESSLKDYFLLLEESNFFNKLPFYPDDDQVGYELGRFIPSLLFTYSLIKDDFNDSEKERVLKMFRNLLYRNMHSWRPNDVGPRSVHSNHGMMYTNLALLTSILLDDDKLFRTSVKWFKKIMLYNTTDTGFMKMDGQRGQCSIHYNLHGLVPLLSILWNLKLQGYDLTQEKLTHSHNLDEIVYAMLKMVLNPHELKDFHKKYKGNYAKNSCLSWMNDKKKEKFYDKELNVVMPYHSTGWIYLYKKISGNQSNIDLFYQSKFLTQDFSLNRNPPGLGDNNTIGALPHLIFR